jgi:uncharacterized coiled-coil DUF342 family protein
MKKIIDWPLLGPSFLSLALLAALIKSTTPSSLSWRIELLVCLILGVALTLLIKKEPEMVKEEPLVAEVEPPVEMIAEITETHEELPPVIDIEVKEEAPKEEFEVKYLQLRKQFDEKSQVLNQTRKELFSIENQLLTLQKDAENKTLEEEPYSQVIGNYLYEIQSLSEEVEMLESMINDLLIKKKGGRPRKAKTKEVEDFLTSIMTH